MSGYLTRIAERAVNAAPIVHANASLPFFGSAEALPMEEAFAAEADAGPTRRMPATRAADVLAPPADAESRAPVPRKPVTTPVGPPSVAPSDSFGRAPAEDPSREHVTTTLEPPAPTRGLTATTSRAPTPEPRQSGDRGVAEPRAGRATETPTVPGPQPRAAAALARIQPEASTLRNWRDGAEPEVHIHIGRIEVTALPEAVPPRKKAASGKKPMSLDEYLQGRARRNQ